jgi:Protein of unknown function (DUF1156)
MSRDFSLRRLCRRNDGMTATAIKENKAQGLAPFSLKNAPSFIEAQFPVGRLSAEAYKARKAGAGQTLAALGSYWKGRKPLILCRAVVLGVLLPSTHDPLTDLDIFLKLMAMDDGAFGRRFDGSAAEFARLFSAHAETVASNRGREWRTDLPVEELKKRAAAVRFASDIAGGIEQPILAALMAFVKSTRATKPNTSAVVFAKVFPHLADAHTEEVETPWRWREDLTGTERQASVAEAFATLPYSFDQRLKHVRGPEECDETELLAPVWAEVKGLV